MVKLLDILNKVVFLKENYSIVDGKPPEINLINEKNNGESVLNLIKKELLMLLMIFQVVV